jgi:hypothetical protein
VISVKEGIINFREYVEETIINRLLDKSKDRKEIPEAEFRIFLMRLNSLMRYFARERKIMGFTEEDLFSFMVIKLHQVLRRGQYDEKKSQYRFFIKTFNNLFNDINRIKDRFYKRHPNEIDAMDRLSNEIDDKLKEFIGLEDCRRNE